MNAEKILKALRNNFEESIFITDSQGKIVFANRIAAERLGVPLEYLESKNVEDLVKDGIYERSTTSEVLRTGKPFLGEIKLEDGTKAFSNSVPVMDEKGNIEMVVTNNMSMARKKEWDDILSKAKAEADSLRRELEYLRLQDKRVIITNSSVMRNVLNTIEAIAPTDSNVVILGKSGTGKDMLARLIHEKSGRQGNAYISINCAAMPESLLESELFGYEAGAFTGALTKGKIGLFEAANGGTLFLDEVGEMSLGLQSKLLRVLENREVRRVGGVKNIPVDIRIVCATNLNLWRLVQEKSFREDLYYRLAVFMVKLPTLAERKEDIIPIAQLFLKELNEKYSGNKTLSQVSIDTMLNYEWPGNIRELRNVIERIYVISKGNELFFNPVPTAKYGDEGIIDAQNPTESRYMSLKDFVTEKEQEYIHAILNSCGGSVSKAAEKLKIHRSALYRKLNKE